MNVIIDTIGTTWYIIIFGFIIPMLWAMGWAIYSLIKYKTITIKHMIIGLVGAALICVYICNVGGEGSSEPYTYENNYIIFKGDNYGKV